jgi:hypothetical protein
MSKIDSRKGKLQTMPDGWSLLIDRLLSRGDFAESDTSGQEHHAIV